MAVTSLVALILVIVGFATSAIIGGILQQNLDVKVSRSANQAGQELLRPFPPATGPTASGVLLSDVPFQPGFLFVVRSPGGTLDGAFVSEDGNVASLTTGQIDDLVDAVSKGDDATVSVRGLGLYRVTSGVVANTYGVIAGLPMSEVNTTIAQILTTVAGVTAGGLLLLAVVIGFIIRASLRPLRAVAETATRVASLPLSEGSVSIADRVPDDESDDRTEIGRVGAALNTLLDHVDASLDARQRNEERMRRFVADASHELRTPLASIRGYSELSLRALAQSRHGDAAPGDPTEQSLERIQAQSLRMTALVEDLLLLARLDEGQELVYGTVDLTRLAVEAVGDARPAGPDHRWVLDVGDTPIQIAGDASRLHQVAANLLANARTHTPAGTEISVTLDREGGEAVLRVHDDGPGVDPAVAKELFERFSRADRSRARQTGGTGLGLSIARAIVEAHHGSIRVHSVPGDTTFEVRLPAKPPDPEPAPSDAAPSDAPASDQQQ